MTLLVVGISGGISGLRMWYSCRADSSTCRGDYAGTLRASCHGVVNKLSKRISLLPRLNGKNRCRELLVAAPHERKSDVEERPLRAALEGYEISGFSPG
jgi:hypothetical protein